MRERLIGFVSVLGGVLAWEAISRAGIASPLYFPAPSAVFFRLGELLVADSRFWVDLGASLSRLAIGALISIPAAVALGVIAEMNRSVSAVLKPWIAITYPIPKLAVFPLLLVIFGIGDASKVAVIAIGVFYLVLMSAMQGVERIVSSGYMDIVRVYRIPFATRVFRIILRGAVPEILTGIKMGLGYGLVMVVGSEFTVSREGIGVFIWNSWDQFRILDLYCGIFVLSLLGVLIFSSLDAIRNRLGGNEI